MLELEKAAGEQVARLLGTEAAHITTGGIHALILSAAACMAGNDPEKMWRLPETDGMRNEFIVQRSNVSHAERSYRLAGGKLVWIGDETGCTIDQLEQAIGPNTAAVVCYVPHEWDRSLLPLEDLVRVAHSRNIPVIADGSRMNYPLDRFLSIAQSADMVCFGAKYFGAPNATGLVCGKKELVDAAAAEGCCTGTLVGRMNFGRGYKIDREQVAAVVVALDEWLSMDHEARLAENKRRLSAIEQALADVPNVCTRVVHHKQYWRYTLHVLLDVQALGKDTEEVAREMDAGDPRIVVRTEDSGAITINPHALNPGQQNVVADKLRAVLSPRTC